MNFAETYQSYPDGQQNVGKPSDAILAKGFIPATATARGQPLAAQWLNWLFREIFRLINRDKVSDAAGVGLFVTPDSFITLSAIDKEDNSKYIHAIGYKGSAGVAHTLTVVSRHSLSLGTATASGDQPVEGGEDVMILATSRN